MFVSFLVAEGNAGLSCQSTEQSHRTGLGASERGCSATYFVGTCRRFIEPTVHWSILLKTVPLESNTAAPKG